MIPAGWDERGFAIAAEPTTAARLDALRVELERLVAVRRSQMIRNGIVHGVEGTAHHLLERNSVILDWLGELASSPLMAEVASALGGKCVLNSVGGVDNRKDATSYVGNIHRDVRTLTPDLRLMMQLLVPLDEFTAETGATWILPGSYRDAEKPDEAAFFARAVQIEARAGEVVIFDSRLWHAAGMNRTDRPRRALTLTFTRHFMKTQFDYCRYLV